MLVLIFSSEKSVPVSEFSPVYAVELIVGHSVGPVALGNTGLVDTGIRPEQEHILNRDYQRIGMACKHRAYQIVVAFVKIVAAVAAVIEYAAARARVELPDEAEEGIIIVSARIGYAIVYIVMRQVR